MKSETQVFLLSDTDHHREAVAHILHGQASISTDPQASDVSIVVGNLDLLEQARQRGRPQPMIMIGMEDDALSAVRALQGGADDYLVYSGHLAESLLAALKKAQQTTTVSDSRDHRTLTEALYDTTVALISTLDFDEVLDRILANVARVVPYDTGTIMLVDGPRARMVRNRRSSDPGQEIQVPTIEFIIDSTPTLSWMLSHRQPIHILDTNDFEGWVPLPQSAWIRAFVGAPIMESGAVIGFLTLNSGQPGTFQAHDAERLQAFANHASIAIRNARLFDTAQRYTAELERRVNERTAELNMERNQLQAILESTGEGIVYTASDRIQYVNQALVRLTGYEAESLIGQPITALDPSGALAEKWQSILTRIRRGILTWRDEVRVTRRDNSIFDAGLTVSLSGHPADEVLHTVTVVRDISQEKALEDQKSRFIATASHELRTPITNLRTRLYLVQHQPERMRDHLQVMNDVVLRMQGLVEDLLDQSRFERGMIRLELDRILLQELIANVVRTQYAEADSKNITLILDLVHQPQYILGDAGRLEQVLTNLLTNSLYYTPERGSVHVRLEANEDTATISVCDTGVGIAPEHLDHVFEAFVRANDQFKGTGLGLSIAKQIIDMHGGEIRVKSEPGRGSCFYVTLKRLDEVE